MEIQPFFYYKPLPIDVIIRIYKHLINLKTISTQLKHEILLHNQIYKLIQLYQFCFGIFSNLFLFEDIVFHLTLHIHNKDITITQLWKTLTTQQKETFINDRYSQGVFIVHSLNTL